jgi:4-hydroxy-tetrahydrodipicolinate synthase
MFTGLSAFPLTPLREDAVDLRAFERLVGRLDGAGVDSITALGSTGSYLYLDRDERRLVARAAVASAGATPVMVGIGALRTSQVQRLADDAQEAGAAAVLLAPVSYQALTDDDVLGLYTDVTAGLSVPLVVYDNPGTTHFTFTDDLYARIAALPNVASIKIPPVPADPAEAAAHVQRIRALLPEHVTIGVSGDSAAATGLGAGCDAWYSVIGGLLPEPALTITRGALADHAAGDAAGDAAGREAAAAASARLEPLWQLFREHGSLRVTAALAEHLGLVTGPSLPLPLRGLDVAARARVAAFAQTLDADPQTATA